MPKEAKGTAKKGNEKVNPIEKKGRVARTEQVNNMMCKLRAFSSLRE